MNLSSTKYNGNKTSCEGSIQPRDGRDGIVTQLRDFANLARTSKAEQWPKPILHEPNSELSHLLR